MAATIGRPPKYNKKILPRTLEYIEKCQDEIYVFQKMAGKTDGFEEKIRTHLPSIAGLALHLGISRETVYDWEGKFPPFSDALTRIRAMQEQALIDGGLSNRYNHVIAKLILSSNHGYKENKDITSGGEPIKGNTLILRDFDGDVTNG